ncbi:BTAD domain-containing putative transcriptional regulator [Streptomyces sp. NPDC058620]|uniref:BTAD domain-containing putative transcriptional regulator n=1 Tax=Streptomyces sp. NPDC058620 TaxID=3346560 RepID=UPI0036585481
MTVRTPEGPVELGPPRRRAVLALLLVNAGQVVSLSSLVNNIWGARPPGQAVTTLQSYISRLRKLVADRPLSGGVQLQLRHRSPGYVLTVPPEHVDVLRFEQAVRRGMAARHRGDALHAYDLLSEALRGWEAPPFEDLTDYEFASQEASRLGDLRLTALEECAECAFALDRSRELLPVLEREVYLHPLRERLVHQLMRAQYQCGRQAEALFTFERTRQFLAKELGADVIPELRQVHESILRHDPALRRTHPVPPAPPLTALHQAPPAPWRHAPGSPPAGRVVVEGPGRAAEPASVPVAPPTATAAAAAGEPRTPPARRGELGRLSAALDAVHRGSGRGVLVVGEAGVGKTWLLQRFGEQCRASDIDVFTVYCPPDDDMPAYWPWFQVLRQAAARRPEAIQALPPAVRRHLDPLLPETDGDPAGEPSPLPPAAGTFAFQEAVSRLLLALADRPLVIVLENFQRADFPSLALTRFLVEQTAESSLLLVVTSRAFRISDDPGWRATRARLLQMPHAEEIRLEGLPPEESRGIMAATLGARADPALCAALQKRSGGNPFLLLGLLDAVGDGTTARQVNELLPPRLAEVITERLSGIPAGVLTVLNACAVLGPESTMDTLRELAVAAGASAHDVGRALRAGLLRASADGSSHIDFLQPLVRDTVRQKVSGRTRPEPEPEPRRRATGPYRLQPRGGPASRKPLDRMCTLPSGRLQHAAARVLRWYLTALFDRAPLSTTEVAQEAGLPAEAITLSLDGELVASWPATHLLVTILGGDPQALRPVWDAASGDEPPDARSEPDARRRLREVLHVLHLAAGVPAEGELGAEALLTSGATSASVPDWRTTKRITILLGADPSVIRPFWDAWSHARHDGTGPAEGAA